MHNVYLGHGRDAIASTLADLLDQGLLSPVDGLSDNDSLLMLHQEFRQWCQHHRIKPPPNAFSLNLIGCGDTKKHATLHTKVKVAHVRVMLGFVAAKALALCDGSRQSRSRSCCIWGLARFCYLCDHAGHWMDQEPLRDCLRAGMLYLMSLDSAGLVLVNL